MSIESLISTKDVVISEEMKKRGFRQQPLVSRPSEVALLSSLLTQLTFIVIKLSPGCLYSDFLCISHD